MKKVVLVVFVAGALQAQAQVGIGTTSPNSTLDVRGSFATNYRTFTASTTVAATDNTLVYTGTAAANVTLPTAVGITGRSYWIKNASPSATTPVLSVLTSSSQTIDGSTTWTLDEPNEIIRVVSDGTNWYVLNQNVAAVKTATTGGSWLQGGNRVTAAKSLGTTNSYDLPFIVNNVERMRINTSGYLGINTTNPAGRLHFVNDAQELGDDYLFDDYGAGTTQSFFITKSRGTVAAPLNLQNGDPIGAVRFVPRYNGSIGYGSNSAVESFYKGDGTTNYTDLRFWTSNAERMRINETGNVAIGTTSFDGTNPEKLLVDAGTTTSFNVISGRGTIDNYLQLNIQNRSAGTSASSDVVASANNGSETANFIDMGINSSAYNNTMYPILNGINTTYLYATGRDFVIGNASSSRSLAFFTNGFASTEEKMRILSNGNVGIGVTVPTDKLTVAGVIAPATDNAYTLGKSGLRWSAVWSANGVIQTSDARLKTNIQPLEYGLQQVLAMQPVRYNWKTGADQRGKIGLIAQEVKKIVPEVVVGDEQTETLGMNYAELVPVLINAVKEQQQKIDALQGRIEALKKKATESGKQ